MYSFILFIFISFAYQYWIGCPGVDTFHTGEQKVFFVQEHSPNGKAKLYGESCGFGSMALKEYSRALSQIGHHS